MITDINTLKGWFKTGDKPTQEQFYAGFDSYWHKNEGIPVAKIEGLQGLLDGKADLSVVKNMTLPSTFFVDRTYTSGDSNGSLLKPFTDLQDAINAVQATNLYARIVCMPNQTFDNVNIDRNVVIVSLCGFSSAMPTISNLNISYSSFTTISGFKLGAVNIQYGQNLNIDNCGCSANIQLVSGCTLNMNNCSFDLANIGIVVPESTDKGEVKVSLQNVSNVSIYAFDTKLYAENCSFSSNSAFGVVVGGINDSGIILKSALGAKFMRCSFWNYKEGTQYNSPVNTIYEAKTQGVNTAFFIGCQVNRSVYINSNIVMNDYYVTANPPGYPVYGDGYLNDHLYGIGETIMRYEGEMQYLMQQIQEIRQQIGM